MNTIFQLQTPTTFLKLFSYKASTIAAEADQFPAN